MKLINNLDSINIILADFIEQDEYTSIGYVPILSSITAPDIITIKKAQKLLDVIIIQNISNQEFDSFTLQSLKQLKPNIIVDYIEETSKDIHISFLSQSINSENILKGILAILPSSIFINSENFEVFKTVNTINNTFKNLFSLHNISTPENLKSFKELEVVNILHNLAKSKQEITKDIIINTLSNYNISGYQEFNINNSLYINLNINDDETIINISYSFTS